MTSTPTPVSGQDTNRSDFEAYCDYVIDGADTVDRDWLFHFCTNWKKRESCACGTHTKAACDLAGVCGQEACGTYNCKAAERDGVVCADGDCDIASGVRTAPVDAPASEQKESPAAEMWAIYFDSLGKVHGKNGFMAGWKLYESKKTAEKVIAGWTYAEHYKPVKVTIYVAPKDIRSSAPASEQQATTASASGECAPCKGKGRIYCDGWEDCCTGCDGTGRAPAPSHKATTASASKMTIEMSRDIRHKLDQGYPALNYGESLALQDFLLSAETSGRATAPSLKAAVPPNSSRDAILESAVQAVSERAGDADKVSVASVYEVIRALKVNGCALPEFRSANSAALADKGAQP